MWKLFCVNIRENISSMISIYCYFSLNFIQKTKNVCFFKHFFKASCFRDANNLGIKLLHRLH